MGRCHFSRAGGGVPERRPSEGRGEDAAESYRRAGPYLDASWQLAGSVALWTLIGWFADRKLHTAPWLLVSGAVLGISLGFYLFFKAVMAIGRKK
jgi:F0F1-type ATP synthase assembly protein I